MDKWFAFFFLSCFALPECFSPSAIAIDRHSIWKMSSSIAKVEKNEKFSQEGILGREETK